MGIVQGAFWLFKLLPKGITVVYALFLVLSSLSVSVREGKPEEFLLALGSVVGGADNELTKNLTTLSTFDVGWNFQTFSLYFNIIGSTLTIFYIVSIFKWLFSMIIPFSQDSPLVAWTIAIIVVFLVQTIFNTASAGQFRAGFTGIANLLTHMDVVFKPFGPAVKLIGNESARNPFF